MPLIDDLTAIGGIANPFWTFGGGTVLMFHYDHRVSKDIDIFVSDPQYLGYLTPRLSDKAADLTTNYVEDASSYVKLQFEEGEIDFVAASNLLEDAWELWEIHGRVVRVERPAEIIAKKMFHRGHLATPRDLFDLCAVAERDPDALRAAAPFLVRYRDEFLQRIQSPSLVLQAGFDAIDTRSYAPTLEHCVHVASLFLEGL